MRVEIPNQITVTIGGLISRGVKAVEVTDAGKLIFTLTDGSVIDLGSVMGPQGPKGEPGDTGPAGARGTDGITPSIGENGNWYLGTTDTGKPSRGEKGEKGDPGAKGDPGEDGAKGDPGERGPKGETGAPGKDGAQGPAGADGTPGQDGTTFTPSVSAAGVLSWTNDGGKQNPASVSIRGPAGTPGQDGAAGPAGADGAPGQDGTTFTPHVSAAGVLSWTNDGGKQNPASVSIKGPAGAAGKDPEPFYVACTLSGQDVYDEDATHDKSFAEILAAHQAGRPCRAILTLAGSTDDDTVLLPLAELNANATDGYVKFALTEMTQGDTPEELRVCYAWIHSTDAAEGFWGSRYTLSGDETFLPDVTASDNGKFLRVSNGAWAAATITNANGGSF